MTVPADDIAELLLRCEASGEAPPYKKSDAPMLPDNIFDSQGPLVDLSSDGADIYVVSDLHLSSGRGADGRYQGSENFFFDASFHRFLRYAQRVSDKAVLIINGDFIDFLRVLYVPGMHGKLTRWQRLAKNAKISRRKRRIKAALDKDRDKFMKDFREWSVILREIGIDKSPEELFDSITDKEEVYGLKTDDYKSVLRLHAVVAGHPEFFNALAAWLLDGNRIFVVKGNHDLEWYWPAVRNFARLALAKRLATMQHTLEGNPDCSDHALHIKSALLETVLPSITFIDHAAIIDGDFYVEHGHPYDPLTRVIGKDTVNGGRELNIPLGSFFNRYLINFLELQFPYLAKVRPTQNILPLMLKNRFLSGIRLLVDHLIVILRTAPRQYIQYIFGQHIVWRVLLVLLIVIAGPALLIWYQSNNHDSTIMRLLEWAVTLVGVYAAIQGLTYAQLSEPDSLAKFARHQFEAHPDYRLITFGHTHNPDQFRKGSRWFYNTGTWIPIIETSATNVRTDRTFTFVHLKHDSDGALQPDVLMRWDDEAQRAEPMVLIAGVES